MKTINNSWKNLEKVTIKKYLKDNEVAEPILDYDDYFVTNFGRVFSAKKKFTHETLKKEMYGCIVWKELKPFYTHRYKTVSLVKDGKKKNIPVHILVYEQFWGAYDKHYFKIVFMDKNTENCNKNNLRLEFKNKSKKTLEKYKKQKQMIELLDMYSSSPAL